MAKLRDEMEAKASLSGLDLDQIRRFRSIHRFGARISERLSLGPNGDAIGVIGSVIMQNDLKQIVLDCDIAPDQTEKDELITILAAIHLGCRELFPKFKGQITPAMIEKRAKELDAENYPAPVDPTAPGKAGK